LFLLALKKWMLRRIERWRSRWRSEAPFSAASFLLFTCGSVAEKSGLEEIASRICGDLIAVLLLSFLSHPSPSSPCDGRLLGRAESVRLRVPRILFFSRPLPPLPTGMPGANMVMRNSRTEGASSFLLSLFSLVFFFLSFPSGKRHQLSSEHGEVVG